MKKILINGVEWETSNTVLSYEEIVRMAEEPDYATVVYHVRNGPSGSLYKGKSVEVVEGMSITALVTGDA